MIFEMTKCEKKLGYVFNDKMLLRKCFTHSSYAHESGEDSNEILEFFGDAIIQFIVTEQIVIRRNVNDEGDLTAQRQTLVSKEPLQRAAEKLGITEYLLIGNGLIRQVNRNDKMYSSL